MSDKKSLEELALSHCEDVFNDYDEIEIKQFSPAIQYCWRVGAQSIKKNLKFYEDNKTF